MINHQSLHPLLRRPYTERKKDHITEHCEQSNEQTSSHRSKQAPWRRKSGTGICHWKSNTFVMTPTCSEYRRRRATLCSLHGSSDCDESLRGWLIIHARARSNQDAVVIRHQNSHLVRSCIAQAAYSCACLQLGLYRVALLHSADEVFRRCTIHSA